MPTEQIPTPYDTLILEGRGDPWKKLANRNKAEGYRQGVADTDARYAELVAAITGAIVDMNLLDRGLCKTVIVDEISNSLQAALAKVKGAENDGALDR